MRRGKLSWAVAGVAAALAAGACSGPHLPPEVRRAAEELDRVEGEVEEWGTVTISAPLLEAPDGDRFKFGLTKKADDFYEDARNNFQGGAADFEQVVNMFGLGVDVAMNPMIAAKYAADVSKYYRQEADFERGAATRRELERRQLESQTRAAEAQYQAETLAAKADYDAAVADAGKKRDDAVAKAAEERDKVLTDGASSAAQKKAAREAYEGQRKAAEGAYKTDAMAGEATRRQAVAEAEKHRADAYAPPAGAGAAGEEPSYPDAATKPEPAPDTLAPNADKARGVLADSKFAGFKGLLGAEFKPKISDRTAINMAAGDRATEAIFDLLGDPNGAHPFQDRQVLFGVSMVAVNPGWRTRKGYAADLAVICRYSYQPARRSVVAAFVADAGVDPGVRRMVAKAYHLPMTCEVERAEEVNGVPKELNYDELYADEGGRPREGGPSPLVAAVSPMTETQTLDLASSFRRQNEVAIRLAFALHLAGLTGQAAAFEQFVKSQQQDVETATAVNTVNAYSHVGGLFGFQVGPRLVAIERVRKGKLPGAAEVLDRQSFPVLVIFGVNRSEAVRVGVKDGRVTAYEAHIELMTQPAWMPTEEGTSGERLLASRRLGQAYDMARRDRQMRDKLEEIPDPPKTPEQDATLRVAELATARRHELRYKAFGGAVDLLLPVGVFGGATEEPKKQAGQAAQGGAPAGEQH
jgi:hypothetical protein